MEKPEMSQIIPAIKQLQRNLDLTPTEFAARLGVSYSYLMRAYGGTRDIDTLVIKVMQQFPATVEAFVKALDKPLKSGDA